MSSLWSRTGGAEGAQAGRELLVLQGVYALAHPGDVGISCSPLASNRERARR